MRPYTEGLYDRSKRKPVRRWTTKHDDFPIGPWDKMNSKEGDLWDQDISDNYDDHPEYAAEDELDESSQPPFGWDETVEDLDNITFREMAYNSSAMVEGLLSSNASEAERFMTRCMFGKISWDTTPLWAKKNVMRKMRACREFEEPDDEGSQVRKYWKLLTGKVNMTTINADIDTTGDVRTLEEYLGPPLTHEEAMAMHTEWADRWVGTLPEGVGLNFTCEGPHFVCMVEGVHPFLGAWEGGAREGDVIVEAGGRPVEELVWSVIWRFCEDYGVPQKVASALLSPATRVDVDDALWRAINPLVHARITRELEGWRGTETRFVVRKHFRRIEVYRKGKLHRHPLYNGEPVYVNVTAWRGEEEDLPVEWDYRFVPCLVDKARHLREELLKELLVSGSISQDKFDREMGRLPQPFQHRASKENSFLQVFRLYKNTVTNHTSFVRPSPTYLEDPDCLLGVTWKFWEAAEAGDVEGMLLWHKQGANVNHRSPDHSHATPLLLAAGRGDLTAVDVLISLRGDPKAVDENGWGALHYACVSNNTDVVSRLLNIGLQIDMQAGEGGWTAMHVAASYRNVEVLAVLNFHGADKTIRNGMGFTAPEILMMISGSEDEEELIDRCIDSIRPMPPGTRSLEELGVSGANEALQAGAINRGPERGSGDEMNLSL